MASSSLRQPCFCLWVEVLKGKRTFFSTAITLCKFLIIYKFQVRETNYLNVPLFLFILINILIFYSWNLSTTRRQTVLKRICKIKWVRIGGLVMQLKIERKYCHFPSAVCADSLFSYHLRKKHLVPKRKVLWWLEKGDVVWCCCLVFITSRTHALLTNLIGTDLFSCVLNNLGTLRRASTCLWPHLQQILKGKTRDKT